MSKEIKIMREVFIEEIYRRMRRDNRIFFLSGDFGSPNLDKLRNKFRDRFLNVGIAEQNLINMSLGLALEGFTVYAYAIAPFLTMRAYEQIRVNLSLHSQFKEININLIGVGAGLSYDTSGPTHHCLEDISIMRVLPNFIVFSPSDWVLSRRFVEFSIKVRKPKYIRLDGKPLPQIYSDSDAIKLENGFVEIKRGRKVCLVSTGQMTHKAIMASNALDKTGVGVIDVFLLKPLNENLFSKALNKYKYVITLEEGFINKGGLDSLVSGIIERRGLDIVLRRMGFGDAYVFDNGNREYLHALNDLNEDSIIRNIKRNS